MSSVTPTRAHFFERPPRGVDLTEAETDVSTRFKERAARFLTEGGWNRYPERVPVHASERLARLLGAVPARLAATSGCTEALTCAFLHARDQDLTLHIPVPSYPGYRRILRAVGGSHCTYDARTAPQALGEQLSSLPRPETRAVVVGSPGNPIGPAWTARNLDRLCASGVGLVVLDLTYALFRPDAEELLGYEDPRVVQCLSLSKSHALAGARIGAMLADPELLRELRGLQPDFPLDLFQLSVCHAADDPAFAAESRIRAQHTLEVTRSLAQVLRAAEGITVVSDPATNFVTVSVEDEWWNVLVQAARSGELRAKVFDQHKLLRVTSTTGNLTAVTALLESRSLG
ncbi:aminotransferase class I/II-fold pyridoxal phosphate-dependent enzyme [Nocardiopsis algeriensis]|uniref:aminotransferase class I/II-fold pyridoxal phosphate-dependent enzyme n=1 Tax=Nocardiopsis algeriensis TaxID=1478215 RepID=UPI003B4284D6